MKRDPVEIVDEFLSHETPRVRKNAVTALGVIQNKKSVERLAHVALEDIDPEVRSAAGKELVGLAESSKDLVATVFESEFRDPKKNKAVYALLGRLRSAGTSFAIAGNGHIGWLRCAWQLFRQAYPVKTFFQTLQFHLRRAIIPALVGCGVSIAIFSIYIIALARVVTLRGVASNLPGSLLAAGLIGVVVTLGASFRTTAFNLHFKPGVGAVAEVGRMVMPCMVISLLICGFVWIAGGFRLSMGDIIEVFVVILLLLGATSATRAGTIISSGFAAVKRLNLVFESIVGSATGIAFLTISAGLMEQDVNAYSVPTAIWFFLLPSIIILASTFAAIDSTVPSRMTGNIKWRTAVSIGIVAFVLLPALALVSFPTATKILGAESEEKFSQTPISKSLERKIYKSPYRLDFNVPKDQDQSVTIGLFQSEEVPEKKEKYESLIYDQAIVLVDDNGRVTSRSERFGAPRIRTKVRGGQYSVMVYNKYLTQNDELDAHNILPNLFSAYRAMRYASSSHEPEKLDGSLNIKIEFENVSRGALPFVPR